MKNNNSSINMNKNNNDSTDYLLPPSNSGEYGSTRRLSSDDSVFSSPESSMAWTPAPYNKYNHSKLGPDTPMITTSAMRAKVRRTDSIWDVNKNQLIVLFTSGMVALLSSTPQVMNIYSTKLQSDTNTSSIYVAVLQGVGVFGLQFTLIAGRILDRYGSLVLCIISAIWICGGYLLMSITHQPVLLFIEFAIVAIGCGGTFLCALSTAIAIRNPLGIGWVSVLMSLCTFFTVFLTSEYGKAINCPNTDDSPDYCWRKYVRMYAIVSAGAFLIGIIGFWYYRRQQRIEAEEAAADPLTPAPPPKLKRTLSVLESFEVFKTRFFWTFFYSMTIGIGSGVFIVTQAKQLWDQYNTYHERNNWNIYITAGFSVMVATTNVVTPILSDYLHNNHIMRANVFLSILYVIVAIVYSVLGVLIALPHRTKAMGVVYAIFLAMGGFGFGAFLVLIPNTVGRHYPIEHFGTYMSYFQAGAAVFAITVPTLSQTIFKETHHYSYMYWGFVILSLIAAAAVYSIRVPRRIRKLLG